MITTLHLRHFVLIQQAVIHFETGLNILTGETGAGKTILIQAINLLMGQKADTDIIRSGEDQATVTASFEIENLSEVHSLLEDAGITFDPKEELIIKREISHTSKNRIFINAQLAPLQLLSQLGVHLFEVAGQNTSTALRSSDQQREILDTSAAIDRAPFQIAYENEKKLHRQLETLKLQKTDAERATQRIQWELEDLQAVDLSEDEEVLFEAYKKQTNSQERTQSLSFMTQELESSVLPTLFQFKKHLPSSELLETALTSLNELSFSLSSELDDLQLNPEQLEALEQKLSKLNAVKKKYHIDAADIPKRLNTLEQELEYYEKLDAQIETLEKAHEAAKLECAVLSENLTKSRLKAKKTLEQELTQEIRLLNMPDAIFQIEITPKELGPEGADQIAFYLGANRGEKPALVKSKTSGGELSRLFFALKLLLAEKEAIPILIFDEIDSNIGGETATLIGEKLLELSQSRQVLCITHFPQVARFATHHLLISKNTDEERTHTTIESLEGSQRQEELLRMMGGKAVLS
ncbi:DNA repair protein RecN [Simkania sp.]|uniref:DNA repair protein RecN n=1 Tax=Simkania sp. TaxID=34094 RepID=UPI003B5159BB